MENYENQRTFTQDDGSVVVIIGSGAGGGTLANELAQKGIDAVVLEAGKLHTRGDFIADEWASFGQLAWLDNRTTSGTWRVARDFPNLPSWIVKAVGGSTVHWAGASLRFQPHEFRVATEYGDIPGANLLDWPIAYEDLAPYYDRAEDRMGVTRTNGIPGLPGNNNFKVMHAGATAIGYKNCHTGNMAINSVPRDGRAGCAQRGFCFQGCTTGAKWSTLFTEIPRALATGHVELRPESQVASIEHDDRGRVSAVVYFDASGNEQRQRARAVAVAGNSIETPRMLLNSASSQFPDGLANSSGQVGRNYMRHMTGSVYASFEEPVHMYRGTTMAGIVQDEAHHDPSRGFSGGYEIETVSLGLPFMAAFFDPGAWGSDFTEAMDQYAHMAGMWLVGEDMPQQRNRVTLNTDVKDTYGLPVPNVHYDDHPNDVAMRQHAFQQGIAIYEAAGAKKAYKTPPYPSTHNLGTCRMSERARDGVCNGFGQTHDIDNLFISDGSQFTTSAAENPTLTIVSLAMRQADYIARQMADRAI
ncbi:GMC family oxidoreductase [Spiribacter vilamensis]|uniref:Choline dehydrogenase-like flavoprotein n=1 Tax=Spiribacter vilamensis TaxID=531306 RepID=A0A4Q8CZG4_9GAMM|nr:GMC family oxidoreductase [Spiribacter vilamensis]RZU98409.1 choline dehydrogenase-like flavoprotein [Spiribacter vilamensis]TVO60712.1 GMC family oxidoreductase [Spiribacter vilamensis]